MTQGISIEGTSMQLQQAVIDIPSSASKLSTLAIGVRAAVDIAAAAAIAANGDEM